MKKRRSALKKVTTILIIAIVGFVLGLYVTMAKPWRSVNQFITNQDQKISKENYLLAISTVEKSIKLSNDLITSKYVYKDANTYENYKQFFGKRVPFTTDKVVFTYKGVVSVGIDISKVKYNLDNDNMTITIVIPNIEIKSNEIDNSSFEYPFESNSIFNATFMSDFTELLATLKHEKEVEVLSDEDFMKQAKMNTEIVLESFLTSADATKNYRVIFKWHSNDYSNRWSTY